MDVTKQTVCFVTSSPDETGALGRKVGVACEAGSLLALVGDLGAGKTRFVKGLAAGLGAASEDEVTSPTFVLMNLHRGGRLPLAHIDLYRLEAVDLASIGFYDYRRDGVIAVEWADKVDEELLGDHLRVAFTVEGESCRRLVFQACGPRSQELLHRLNLSP